MARTGGELIYAVGDVHGRYDLLKQLLFHIRADWRTQSDSRPAAKPPVLVFCGDYIDRGPQSAEVVEAIQRLTTHLDWKVQPLRGNHEQALLDFIADPKEGWAWLEYGGRETLTSYGVAYEEKPRRTRQFYVQLRDEFLRRLPASHLRFLEGLPLHHVAGDYLFVHAGVRPGVPFEEQTPEDLLWIRDEFRGQPFSFDRIVIHGHTWTGPHPEIYQHRIGLDTGAYETGVLTAARISDGGLSILKAEAPQRPADIRRYYRN
ncbi:MAG: serine/threonine protein phosphatase [Caulobacteraceae bacterium]|nr:serine/threonine protein phosphatase [Caulobacteraceae bacterium]